MGVINSLLESLRGVFGSNGAPTAAEPAPAYRCTICGTEVDSPGETCPLCGSTDTAANDDGAAAAEGLSGRPAAEQGVVDDTSTAASRLAQADLLTRFEDRWERVDGGYRVVLPDGDRKVDSRDEVRALLYRHDPDRREG